MGAFTPILAFLSMNGGEMAFILVLCLVIWLIKRGGPPLRPPGLGFSTPAYRPAPKPAKKEPAPRPLQLTK